MIALTKFTKRSFRICGMTYNDIGVDPQPYQRDITMRTMRNLIFWVAVVAIAFISLRWAYDFRHPADPPGWQEFHDQVKSGPTPEEILRSRGIDPATMIEDGP